MQIETKIELARVKVMLQFFKDLNKLASNIYLSSHFPSFINIQTGDSCNCDGELETCVSLKSPHPCQPLGPYYSGERREEMNEKVFRLVGQDRVSVTPPNLALFMILVKLLKLLGLLIFTISSFYFVCLFIHGCVLFAICLPLTLFSFL